MMFIKSSLITLALVLSTSATPLVEGLGTRVAFEKRTPLTSGDGLFDHSSAIMQIVYDRNKHRQNLINLQQTSGTSAWNEGAQILPVAELPEVNLPDTASSPGAGLSARQAESLTDEANDEYWAGTTTIGSTKEAFLVDFDTGSSDLWVPSIDCKSSSCKGKHKYDAGFSSTCTYKPGKFSLEYSDKSSVSGHVYTDTVTVAGVTVRNQYLSGVTTLSSSFAGKAMDGIMGMAYPALSQLGGNPFFNTAKAQGAVKAGEFGLKLAKSGSELYLGGTNSKLYSGRIEWQSVAGSGFWQMASGKVLVGSKPVVSNIMTVIDSGTTLVYGPPGQVANLYKSIPGSKVFDSANGLYTFPCNAVPNNVAFNWGGRNWTISAANMNLGRVSETQCAGAIIGQDLGLGKNVWLVGDSFLKNVYSVFSFDKNAVGFASLK